MSSYRANSIHHPNQPAGGRDLSTYEGQLQVDRSALLGKKILDLGSGPHVKLAQQLHDLDSRTTVVSLSPDFSDTEHRTVAQEKGLSLGVAALGQALPFKNNSFDGVLALHVQEHLSRDGVPAVVAEIARVLKPGGVGKLGPVPDVPYDWGSFEDASAYPAIDALNAQGVHVSKQPIPTDVIPFITFKDAHDFRHYDVPSFVFSIEKQP
ncbi:MAG TPA: class I SAM-dependent methyltransferase [Candidatus Saccharimonadales bacterium]|nr:class I SAM-dependent methyltransferase [Candidatus Saccharimonadales bacterium]